MKKMEIIRLIAIPLAFIAIVAFAFIASPNTRYVSEKDILSVAVTSSAGESATLDTPEGIHAFVEWLTRTVPEDELCFVRETDRFLDDDADWTMVVDQVPDAMKGLDSAETFSYSIYHMYVYVQGTSLYYNGVIYDMPEDAVTSISNFISARN